MSTECFCYLVDVSPYLESEVAVHKLKIENFHGNKCSLTIAFMEYFCFYSIKIEYCIYLFFCELYFSLLFNL